MKFGIALPNFGRDARRDNVVKLAKTAEEFGFDSIWVSDHIVIPDSHKGFGDVFYEPFVTLAYVSSITEKINLGTSVIILPYRNPLVVAKMISTLDVLSGGRVILGAGTGWLKDEFEALSIPYADRGFQTDEHLEAMKVLWTRKNPKFKGKFYKFSDIRFFPKPVQKPYPPIWIGGNSNRAIERAARSGDGWHAVGLTPEEMKYKSKYLMGLIKGRSKRKTEFVISLRKNLQILGPGEKDRKIDEREVLRASPEKIAESIEEYEESGVSHLVFQVLGSGVEDIINTIKIFAEEISPTLKLKDNDRI